MAGLLEDAGRRSGAGGSQWTARMTVGALAFLLASKVSRGETAELPGMLPDLLYVALAPYLGAEAAMTRRADSPQEAIDLLVEAVRAAAGAEPELVGQVEAGASLSRR